MARFIRRPSGIAAYGTLQHVPVKYPIIFVELSHLTKAIQQNCGRSVIGVHRASSMLIMTAIHGCKADSVLLTYMAQRGSSGDNCNAPGKKRGNGES